MRISEIKQASSGQSDATGSKAAPSPDAGESRALVALTPTAPQHETLARRHQAPFLAHLLAVKEQHPQTRARRRAAPHEAIAAYRAAAGLTGR